MSGRAAARVAWSVCLLCVVLAAGSLLFSFLNGYSLREMIEEDVVAVAVLTVTFSIVGALIASHRPTNPIGWIFCAAALFQGLNIFGEHYATYALITRPGSLPLGAEVSWIKDWIWFPGLALILVFLPLLFPDGRPPSRRWRPVAWFGGSVIILFSLVASTLSWFERDKALLKPGQTAIEGPAWLYTLAGILFPLLLVTALAAAVSLLVRFWQARGEKRQQIKWFAFAAILMLVWIVAYEVLPFIPNEHSLVAAVVGTLAIASIPVATAIAILRYRLYDIDVFINRTLVYGSLTVSLVLTYIVSVVTLQGAFRTLTGQESTLAVVASTLAVAALFNPLRHRVQGFIDRRFYRRKYDAAKTLEAFSAKLRDETDLDRLSGELVSVVRETMEPKQVSLWLRPPKSK